VIPVRKAAARFDGIYANGEMTYYLRGHSFAIKVMPSWRDLYASGQKLSRQGLPPHAVPERLGITVERWREIHEASTIMVIVLQLNIQGLATRCSVFTVRADGPDQKLTETSVLDQSSAHLF
jgi:hypothetical protein